VSEEIAGVKAYRIADVTELDRTWLDSVRKVAVTSGASTPTPITKEVIAFLESYDPKDETTWEQERTINFKRLIPAVRTKASS
jgi:4-hydroxy-3-methylbut-2-enyl diphosphate reductase